MMVKCFHILIWLTVFKLSRGISLGNESVLGKKYLVYFVKSPYSRADNDAWICAGTLVTHSQILTAAACLVEMEKIYAIAGYKKYVHGSNIANDQCTNMIKQKVVKVSVPKEYNLSSEKQFDWLNVDIGIAIVEKPYDFTDQLYRRFCSYEPQSLFINFEKANELEKTRAMTFGWGIKKSTSKPEQAEKKPQVLQEANSVIIDKGLCSKLVANEGSKDLLKKYLLCASSNEGISDVETRHDTRLEECPVGRRYDLSKTGDTSCFDEDFDFRSRDVDETYNKTKVITSKNYDRQSRRSTATETCQNDHGGPLVAWVGSQEMILGVALNILANKSFDCFGPQIYVSTAESVNIIKCLLERDPTKRKSCNEQIIDKRYEVKDIDIKWPEDSKNQTSNVSTYLRQGNEEEPLHVRPTKDLDQDKQNDQNNPQIDKILEETYYQMQEQPPNAQELTNLQYRQGEHFIGKEQQQPYGSKMHGLDEPNPNLNKPPMQVDTYNLPQIQPQSDSYRQSQLNSQPHQPQADPYNPPQPIKSINPPPPGETFNQSPLNSFKGPTFDSYNPLDESSNHPTGVPIKQPLLDSYNPQPKDINNQQHGQLFSNPQIGALKSPQIDTLNQPHIDSYQPPQFDYNNQPQKDTYNQPIVDQFKQSFTQKYNQPIVEQFKKPETDTFNVAQPKEQVYNQPQVQPQPSSYNNFQKEPIKSPVVPYNHQEPDSFKIPVVQPFKAAPMDPYTNLESPVPQPLKSPPVQPYEQPIIGLIDQPHAQHEAQSSDQQQIQSFERSQVQALAQPFEVNPMRNIPQTNSPSMDVFRIESDDTPTLQDSLRAGGEPQEFERIYSQLHSSVIEIPSSDPPEQTFDEIYKNLHDDTVDIPHDVGYEAPTSGHQNEPPQFEQQFDSPYGQSPKSNGPEQLDNHPLLNNQDQWNDREQSNNQYKFNDPRTSHNPDQYNQRDQFKNQEQSSNRDYSNNREQSNNGDRYNDQALNTPERINEQEPSNNWEAVNYNERPDPEHLNAHDTPNDKQQDDVKVRPQMPLEYPDYMSYSRRSEKTLIQ